MPEIYHGPSETAFLTRKKMKARDIPALIAMEDTLEKLDLRGSNLVGEALCGKNILRSDLRGISLYKKADAEVEEQTTDIRDTTWRECIMGEQDPEGGLDFRGVNAEGAQFGYFETLTLRRKRHKESKGAPKIEDTGALYNFDGRNGNFAKTKWENVDFGGFESGYVEGEGYGMEALFAGADFTEAEFIGCDMGYLDLTQTNITNIKIVDPYTLKCLKIKTHQTKALFVGLTKDNPEIKSELDEIIDNDNSEDTDEIKKQKALAEYFEIIIVD